METPETTPTPEKPCPSCGTAMAPAQDWCLECGTAAPGRLSTRSGRAGFRAATTIIATVLLLVGGAVAASYAALNSKAEQAATAPAPPSAVPQVAQTPTTTTTAAPPPAAPVTPPPVPEPAPTPAPVPTPPPTPPATPVPTPPVTPPADTTPTTPTEPVGNHPLDLGVDVASLYDPYDSATDSTDPADSYDENGDTVYTITTDAQDDMAVGLAFDLETKQTVEKVYFRTTTPGFGVEVYGAQGKLPPDILDTRWQQLGSRKKAAVDEDSHGLVKIVFDPGKYTHIVLWFTTPPPAETEDGAPAESATVGISEVRILD